MNSHLAAPASEEATPRAPSPKRHADGTLKGPPDAIADQARAGPKPRLREPMRAKIPENQRTHRPNALPEHRQNRSPAPTHHHERTHKTRAVGALATQRSAALRCAALARSLAARHRTRTAPRTRAPARLRVAARRPEIRTRDRSHENNSPPPLDHMWCTPAQQHII